MSIGDLAVPKVIGEYLDSLTDEERDRVIEAEKFVIGGGYKHQRSVSKIKQRVIGDDFRMGAVIKQVTVMLPTEGCLIDHAKSGTTKDKYGTVGSAFDQFYRYGGAESIRAIKMYAAKLNKVELGTRYESEAWTPLPSDVEVPTEGAEVS